MGGGGACVFTCKGCTEMTRLVGEVGDLRQMMESMKRISIIMFMCHILLLNVAKMHLPIEVPFYGMRFQKILRSVNR